jgi:CelD/BcsL family acetyltransferase involved in cellulose biosynthesis
LTGTSWEEYRQSLPRQFRTNLTTRWNKLKQMSGSYQVEKITSFENFASIFDELVETSARSWKAQTKTDLRSTPKIQQFYKDFSRLTSEQPLYELWLMRIDSKLAAFEYYLKGSRSLSAIRTDFDMAYKAYGPGHSLKVHVLQDVFAREGVWEYDFGGLAYDYKLRWTNTVREHLNIAACSNHLYGKVLMYGKKRLLPLIRGLRKREQAADNQLELS